MRARGGTIVAISLVVNIAQIFQAIIAAGSVDMVYLSARPSPMGVQPSETPGTIKHAVHPNPTISRGVYAPGHGAGLDLARW